MQNIAGKKRVRQEAVDPDYLFVDAQREIPKVTVTSLSPAPPEDCNIMQSILERRRGARRLHLADRYVAVVVIMVSDAIDLDRLSPNDHMSGRCRTGEGVKPALESVRAAQKDVPVA
jgi:hypothetical protein